MRLAGLNIEAGIFFGGAVKLSRRMLVIQSGAPMMKFGDEVWRFMRPA